MHIKHIDIKEPGFLKSDQVKEHFLSNENILEVSKNGQINFDIVRTFIKGQSVKPNLYGLLTKSPNESKWRLRYIGQRKAKYITERLRQHLKKKNRRTGSKLEDINQALKNNNAIGLKLAAITPDTLRHYYEEILLKEIPDTNWNIQR